MAPLFLTLFADSGLARGKGQINWPLNLPELQVLQGSEQLDEEKGSTVFRHAELRLPNP